MQWMTVCELRDLLATTETVCNDRRAQAGAPHCRQEVVLAHLHRNVVLVFLKSERAGHSAAARGEFVQLRSHFSEQVLFMLSFLDNRLVMAMSMHHHFGAKLRQAIRIG